ncbi:MAG: hypothetical protein WAU36_19750 [Cyclobacteriaceae bacterium]
MDIEELNSSITLKFLSGIIDISILSTERLIELGIADKASNIIDTKKLRLGYLGAYIKFLNDSEDEITVKSSSIEISSSIPRMVVILKGLAQIFGDLEILSGELTKNLHLTDDDLPERIINRLTDKDSYVTKIIQLRKGENIINLFQCGKNILHVKQIIQLLNKTKFNELSLEKSFNLEIENKFLDEFIEKKLKI